MAPMARLAHLDPWGRGLYSLRLLDLMGHSARSDLMGQARCSRPLLHLFLQYHQRRRCHLFHLFLQLSYSHPHVSYFEQCYHRTLYKSNLRCLYSVTRRK